MNKHVAWLALASVFATASMPSAAQAADGQITFDGEISANTCTVQSPTNGSGRVALPKVSATAFGTGQETAGYTRFVIRISDCPTVTQARAHFEGDPVNVHYPSNSLRNQHVGVDAAGNVGFALYDEQNGRITIGSAAQTSWRDFPTGAMTPVDLPYGVSYVRVADAPVQAGRAEGVVQYSIEYP